jgi:hypothetical protein
LTAHYGAWHAPEPGKRKPTWRVDPRLVFGILYKIKAGRRLKDLYSRIRCGTRKQWQARTLALGFTGKVQTAFVERANLTLRELIAPLARRTGSLARSHESLQAAIQWGACCYHFTRPTIACACHGPASGLQRWPLRSRTTDGRRRRYCATTSDTHSQFIPDRSPRELWQVMWRVDNPRNGVLWFPSYCKRKIHAPMPSNDWSSKDDLESR